MRSDRNGFTLIELLIVVVIIGILAAIAIPKFASTKEKTYIASMKTDLRNLVGAQEGYSIENGGVYYGGGIPAATFSYRPTTGVTVTIVSTVAGGWAATATHAQASARTCAIFYGTHAAVAPATNSGEPTCS